MAAKAGRLQVQLELEVAQLKRDLATTNALIAKSTDKIQNDLKKATNASNSFFSSIKTGLQLVGAAEIAKGLGAVFTDIIEDMGRINDESAKLGDTVEMFQRLEQAAGLSGVEMESVVKASNKLQLNLQKIASGDGDDAAAALKSIGVELKDIQGLAPGDAFLKVAGALGSTAGRGKEAAAGTALFSKAWQDLIPFISQGEQGMRDAMAAAHVMSAEVIKAGDDFGDTFDAMKTSIRSFLGEAIGPLLPIVTQLVTALAKFPGLATSVGSSAGAASGQVTALALGLKVVANSLLAFTSIAVVTQTAINSLASAFGIWAASIVDDVKVVTDVLATLKNPSSWLIADDVLANAGKKLDLIAQARTQSLAKNGSDFVAMFKAQNAAVLAASGAISNAGLDPNAAKEAADAAKAAAAAQAAAAAAAEQAEKDAQGRADAKAKAAKDAAAAAKATADAQAEAARMQKQADEDAAKAAQQRTDAQMAEWTARKKANLDLEESEKRLAGLSDQAIKDWRRRAEHMSDYAIRTAEINDQVALNTKAVEDNAAATKAAADEAQALADQWGSFVTAAIDDVFSGLTQGADAATDAVKRLLIQLAAQLAAMKAIEIFRWVSGSASLVAKGAAYGFGGAKMFAQGGVFNSPTAFTFGGGQLGVMGEAGPEAVMPLKRGADGKLGVAGGGMVNVYNYAGAAVSVERNRDETRIIIDRVRSQIAADISRGGNSISGALERAYAVRR